MSSTRLETTFAFPEALRKMSLLDRPVTPGDDKGEIAET
jgi:hypothetical protein